MFGPKAQFPTPSSKSEIFEQVQFMYSDIEFSRVTFQILGNCRILINDKDKRLSHPPPTS